MDGGDGQAPAGEMHDRYYLVSGEALNRLSTNLTVAHGYAQLLRRQVGQDPARGDDGVDQAIILMEAATREMAAELRTVMERLISTKDRDSI